MLHRACSKVLPGKWLWTTPPPIWWQLRVQDLGLHLDARRTDGRASSAGCRPQEPNGSQPFKKTVCRVAKKKGDTAREGHGTGKATASRLSECASEELREVNSVLYLSGLFG